MGVTKQRDVLAATATAAAAAAAAAQVSGVRWADMTREIMGRERRLPSASEVGHATLGLGCSSYPTRDIARLRMLGLAGEGAWCSEEGERSDS